jgi:hypothetical protein
MAAERGERCSHSATSREDQTRQKDCVHTVTLCWQYSYFVLEYWGIAGIVVSGCRTLISLSLHHQHRKPQPDVTKQFGSLCGLYFLFITYKQSVPLLRLFHHLSPIFISTVRFTCKAVSCALLRDALCPAATVSRRPGDQFGVNLGRWEGAVKAAKAARKKTTGETSYIWDRGRFGLYSKR